MENQPSSEAKKTPRESGAIIHRRETNWQIYLPFLLGIATLLTVFLILALPSDPVWRDRAQAIGDFLYTLFCIIPFILCLFPVYILILLSIYASTKLHDGTERPLRKLEQLTASLAERIETTTDYVNSHTTSLSNSLEPLDNVFNIFDEPESSNREDITSDERTESTGSIES